jgi:modulator of FtsH protease
MHGWENFCVAQVGASAALAGLVFVGVSINLTRILSIASLPYRALGALLALGLVLLTATVLLVPEQRHAFAGAEVLLLGLVGWYGMTRTGLGIWRTQEAPHRQLLGPQLALSQLAALPFVVAGLVVLLHGGGGVYWVVPGVICAYLVALSNAWVLLVEINR